MNVQVAMRGVPMYLDRRSEPDRSTWVPHVEAWEPIYLKDYGNSSLIYLEDGTRFYLGKTSLRVYEAIAAYHAIDIKGLRQHYIDATKKCQSVPLTIVSRDITFFNFKSRPPAGRNDGAMAYVADKRISIIDPLSQTTTRITLNCGHTMHALVSANTLIEHQELAHYFGFYLYKNGILPYPKGRQD